MVVDWFVDWMKVPKFRASVFLVCKRALASAHGDCYQSQSIALFNTLESALLPIIGSNNVDSKIFLIKTVLFEASLWSPIYPYVPAFLAPCSPGKTFLLSSTGWQYRFTLHRTPPALHAPTVGFCSAPALHSPFLHMPIASCNLDSKHFSLPPFLNQTKRASSDVQKGHLWMKTHTMHQLHYKRPQTQEGRVRLPTKATRNQALVWGCWVVGYK